LGIEQPETTGEAFINTGKNILSGAGMEAGGQVGGKIISKGLEKIMAPLASKMTPEGEALIKTYEKYNQEPLPSEIIPSFKKTASIIESVMGYRPITGDVMYKKSITRLTQLNKIMNELKAIRGEEKQVENVGMGIKREAEALISKYKNAKGEKLQSMVNEFMNRLGVKGQYEAGKTFEEIMAGDRQERQEIITNLYNQTKRLLPQTGDDIVPLSSETESMLDNLLKEQLSKPTMKDVGLIKSLQSLLGRTKGEELPEGITSRMLEKDPTLKNIIENIQKPQMTWDGLKNLRSDLLEKSRIIKRTQGEATKKSRVYDMIADAIDNDMASFAEKEGGDLWDTFTQARIATKNMHELYDKDILKIMHKPPEDIVKQIVNNGEVTLLRQIKNAVGEQGVEPLRQGFFKQTIDSATEKGMLNPTKLNKILTSLGDDTLKELATPEQIKTLKNIVTNGEKIITNIKSGNMKTLDFLETIAGTSNENIVNAIFKPNATFNLRLAKKLLSPDRIQDIQSIALQKIFKTTSEGNYLPVQSAKEFNKYQNTLRELLDTDALNKIKEFITLSKYSNQIEKLALNASQTGQVLVGSSILGSTLSNPTIAWKTLGVPWMLSKIYISPMARQYLTTGFKMNPNTPEAISNFMKATQIVINNLIYQEENQGGSQ